MSLANKFGIPESLLDASKRMLEEANEYQKKVQAHMAKKGIKSLNDLNPDQKKKFFNDLDAMHKAKNEEVEAVEEELKGDMHPDAHKVLKHIKPEHHGTYKPYLKKGTYKGDYKDRAAVLSAAEKAGHVKEEVESVELTQEDLDFIASLNQIEEGSGPKEKQKTPYRNINSPASRAAADKRREEMDKEEKSEKGKKLLGKIAAKNEEVDLDEASSERIVYQVHKDGKPTGDSFSHHDPEKARKAAHSFVHDNAAIKNTSRYSIVKKSATKVRGGVKINNEEFDLDDFTVEEIEEYMQTEEFAQLDELSKETLGSYVKKRSHDVATQGALTRKHAMDSEAKKKETGGYTTKAVRDLDDKANRAFMKGWKHRQNIARAVDKIVNKA